VDRLPSADECREYLLDDDPAIRDSAVSWICNWRDVEINGTTLSVNIGILGFVDDSVAAAITSVLGCEAVNHNISHVEVSSPIATGRANVRTDLRSRC
jgi:hypothetical protein